MAWPLIRLIDDIFVYLRHSECQTAAMLVPLGQYSNEGPSRDAGDETQKGKERLSAKGGLGERLDVREVRLTAGMSEPEISLTPGAAAARHPD